MATKQFTLGAQERIKSRKQLQRLFTEGNSFVCGGLRIIYIVEPATTPRLQVAAGASKRKYPHAIDRNRIKRLLKEAYRLQKNILMPTVQEHNDQLYIFLSYIHNEILPYKDIYTMVGSSLAKIKKQQYGATPQA